MKVTIFIALLLLSMCSCYATEVKFVAKTNVLTIDNTLLVTFPNISDPTYTVKAITDKSVVKLYDKLSSTWVIRTILFPYMRVQVTIPCGTSSMLYFEVQNRKTFEVYRTNTKRIWPSCLYSAYIGKLNASL